MRSIIDECSKVIMNWNGYMNFKGQNMSINDPRRVIDDANNIFFEEHQYECRTIATNEKLIYHINS